MHDESISDLLPPGHRSGFVAIVGKPNVGKSTLLNTLLSFKLAIVTSKPQTTRNRVVGIRTDDRSQVIFVDTPGIHRPDKELNRALLEVAKRAVSDVDLVLYLADSQEQAFSRAEQFALDVVSSVSAPKVLAPNKIDRIKKHTLLPLIERYRPVLNPVEVVPICARDGDGVDTLMEVVTGLLPEGPRYYPGDQVTDIAERDIAAEIVREKIFLQTQQEIPYASAVVVEQFEELPDQNLVRIHATIHVEKQSQKGILIGKGGSMLREIGQASRLDIERFLGSRVYLELFVRVEKNWTRDAGALRRLGLLEK